MEDSTLAVEKKVEHEREVIAREKLLWEKARVPHSAYWEVVWPAFAVRMRSGSTRGHITVLLKAGATLMPA